MIVRKLLKIQANIEDRKVPYDMNDADLNQHYSESKGQFQNILDMDLIHLIRSYSKLLHHRQILNIQLKKKKIFLLTFSLSHVNRIIIERIKNGLYSL